MDLPRSVLAHLERLATDGGLVESALTDALADLVTDLDRAVPGLVALHVVLVRGHHPVTVRAMQPSPEGAAVTSLRLPLQGVLGTAAAGSRAVFYSSTPGALVNLSVDLAHVLEVSGEGGPADGAPGIELDVDLPLRDTGSGVTGLQELATIERAAGFLVGQGHDPNTVMEGLHLQAAAGGIAVHVLAAQLLLG